MAKVNGSNIKKIFGISISKIYGLVVSPTPTPTFDYKAEVLRERYLGFNIKWYSIRRKEQVINVPRNPRCADLCITINKI